jgi:YegS/Rv2252/BmrU family lipid kinase
MPKYKLVVNPAAGRGAGGHIRPKLEEILDQTGVSYEIFETTGPGDATRFAREFAPEPDDVIVAVGGDGTAHEIVNGLVLGAQDRGEWTAGKPVGTLGLIPVGSGDDLAWGLGFPQVDLEAACRILLADHRRVVDLGQVTDDRGRTEIFHNHLGGAFEAAVAIESTKLRGLPGMLLYLVAVARIIPQYHHPVPITVSYGGATLTRPMLLASTANGGRTGRTFKIAPAARPDDGLLDLVLASTSSIARILWLLPQFMNGTHTTRTKYVTMDRVSHLIMEAPGGIPVHLDGEIYNPNARRLEVDVLPGRLQVIAVPGGR